MQVATYANKHCLPVVIPADAGIQNRGHSLRAVESTFFLRQGRRSHEAGDIALDPRVRGNDVRGNLIGGNLD